MSCMIGKAWSSPVPHHFALTQQIDCDDDKSMFFRISGHHQQYSDALLSQLLTQTNFLSQFVSALMQ